MIFSGHETIGGNHESLGSHSFGGNLENFLQKSLNLKFKTKNLFPGHEASGGQDFGGAQHEEQQHDFGPAIQPATSYQNHQVGHPGGGYGAAHDFGEAHSFSGQSDKTGLSTGFSSSVGQIGQRW